MILSCSALSVSYGSHKALQRFDFRLERGEIRALIGPNGSGKSTALQATAGLIQPSAGRVTLDGRTLSTMSRRELARRLSFMPQQPQAPDEMTVEQLVRQGRFAHVGLLRSYGPADFDAIDWALESTGLTALAQRSLRQLSGGERQRAWISAALAQQADIIMLDEPTSFLDIGHQVEVLELLTRLARERAVTVVMALHDLNQAMAVCDRISLLEEGRLVFDGTAEALAASGLIERVFNVRGRFVSLGPGSAPHFDVEIGARPPPSVSG
ncbi:ABC transporter ATP-binding protein [Labrys portucalensis]|uniref:ABC transporter ATP-binding protein n=1 Tax=Labrys neptuniae TaxID=376174 RepID=A0ABV6ZLH8_9HYPH